MPRRTKRRKKISGRPRLARIPEARLAALCRQYHVSRLALFGSAARGELTTRSDVDLLIQFAPGKAPSLWKEPELREAFGALFGGRRVELVPPQVLENPYRRRSILRDLRVLYEIALDPAASPPSAVTHGVARQQARRTRTTRPARA